MAIKVDPLFKRNAAKEAAAIAGGRATKESIDERGGINASGYYGDSWSADKNLSDDEYAAIVAKGGKVGAAINTATAAKAGGKLVDGADSATGDKVYTALDGTQFTDQQAFVTYQISLNETRTAKEAIAAEDLSKRTSAYELLRNEFAQYGMGGLVEKVKEFIMAGVSPSEFTMRLRETQPYKDRFKANEGRIKAGLAAISEAEYINLEDQYQNIMRNYGLPASYYTKGDYGVQVGFQKFIESDVSATELEDRIMTAQQRVINSNPEVLASLKSFYPDITNGDILAYTLDPKNALDAIKRKVTAAEIGGAATQAGLKTGMARAEELGAAGVTKAVAQQGFETVAGGAPRGGQLASIYGQDPYTQTTAETEVFGLTGKTEAAKQRKKVTGLEKATFGGQSGATSTALVRDRAGAY
jgi:hypothetical protein